jgi:hypothetical protein
MTKREFDRAVERLRHEGRSGAKTDADTRVFVAASLVMRQRSGIPDDQPWEGHPTDAELAEFFAGLDFARLKRLKEVAEGLISEVVGPAVPKTRH